MPEPETLDRLASRLENLRKLGDRNRAQHPVSVLRHDIVGQESIDSSAEASADDLPDDSLASVVSTVEPSIEDRTCVLARRLFSPIIARAALLAGVIRRESALMSVDEDQP